MRSFLISALVMAITAGISFAQLEKDNVRLGLQANVTVIEDANSMMLSVSPGLLVSKNIEIGGQLILTKVAHVDTYGGISGGLIYHFTPDKKVVPGVGFSVGGTFGNNPANATTIQTYFILDSFVTNTWAITLQSGYQRNIYERNSTDAFTIAVGISAFIKK